ncbi:MAG TPA: ArsA-related P-loop ATPase, partial [Lachnospiraceae bacterium]|nr:ArsA-related P-loop ATPase [Lachnospiraceae bacterium]
MRIIIYTGKGGVGKTSMAAASACEIAARGKKVIVV